MDQRHRVLRGLARQDIPAHGSGRKDHAKDWRTSDRSAPMNIMTVLELMLTGLVVTVVLAVVGIVLLVK